MKSQGPVPTHTHFQVELPAQMASPIGAIGSFDIKADSAGNTVKVHISEPDGVSSENLSLSTWGASFILANHLHKISLPSPKSSGRQLRTLELGAGTALVGLSAAVVWKADVTLTDLPAIVPGLEANISLNSAVIQQNGCQVQAGSLDWTSPNRIVTSKGNDISAEAESNKFQLILAADTIYDEDHPELLTNTIVTWLAHSPDSRAVMCYPLRMAYINHIRDFWERMEAAGLECCEEGKEIGEEEWNEVANTPYEWCVWQWKM